MILIEKLRKTQSLRKYCGKQKLQKSFGKQNAIRCEANCGIDQKKDLGLSYRKCLGHMSLHVRRYNTDSVFDC